MMPEIVFSIGDNVRIQSEDGTWVGRISDIVPKENWETEQPEYYINGHVFYCRQDQLEFVTIVLEYFIELSLGRVDADFTIIPMTSDTLYLKGHSRYVCDFTIDNVLPPVKIRHYWSEAPGQIARNRAMDYTRKYIAAIARISKGSN